MKAFDKYRRDLFPDFGCAYCLSFSVTAAIKTNMGIKRCCDGCLWKLSKEDEKGMVCLYCLSKPSDGYLYMREKEGNCCKDCNAHFSKERVEIKYQVKK